MSKKIAILMFILCLSITSCVTKTIEKEITDFPQKPELVQYESGPIYKKIGDNYEVSGKLVTNSVMLNDYSKRIDTWKLKKNIR